MLSKLKGKKTYAVAITAVAAAIAGYFDGSLSNTEAIMAIVGAILAATLRDAVTSEAKKQQPDPMEDPNGR